MSRTFLVQNGDLVYDTSGSNQMIEGKPKLRQDLGEMLAIEVQPDGFGAGIANAVSVQSSDDGIESNLEFLLRERLFSASQRFIAMQRRSLQNRTLGEVVRKILFIDAERHPTDPTLYRWRVDYETEDGSLQTVRGRLGA